MQAASTRPSRRLATRIVCSSLVALVLVASMVGGTLWLSWQLEGAAAAINDTGSLRMRANRLGLALLRPGHHESNAWVEMQNQHRTLLRLANGVPDRPLFLPDTADIRRQFEVVDGRWRTQLVVLAEAAMRGGDEGAYLRALPGFVTEADRLVQMIEKDSAIKTVRLRLSQGALIVLACLGTAAMIFLLYRWIITPVNTLQEGLHRMSRRDFSVRLPVTSRDELGELAKGFNRMADELEGLYQDLGNRVKQKTLALARQNRQLSALYGMTAFLNQPNDIEGLCRGFLTRVMDEFHAEGGSIRVLDPSGERLYIVVSVGLSSGLEEREHCMHADACFCGEATHQGTMVIQDFRHEAPRAGAMACVREGFQGVSVFQIVTPEAVLGTYSLHFKTRTNVPAREVQLLEMLGRHLGAALDNRRLSAKAQQLAVAEERNLVAQGLHDSLAQGLNFLNLQTQMLGTALQQRNWAEVAEIVPLLKTGVAESYQDVRELLQNFRTRLSDGSMREAVEDTIARFRRQTGILVEWHMDEAEGAPLHPDEQLQILFILQEALSNVRKHAHATRVNIQIRNRRDFEMNIQDNGEGYDPLEVAARTEPTVGLSIMQERAARLHGRLRVHTAPGEGTEVQLLLAQQDRLPA
ncbi:MAG: type IV pili methyl-accepting chemotaxis transducer N-terminal domain-containing protein [Lautropia sp.]|nr:type IV pili methyl-accepting chemotaxis transducer N-terminal domain-containing protein [Lautropia sp.]